MNASGTGGITIRSVDGPDSPHLPTAVRLFRDLFPSYAAYIPFIEACAEARSPRFPAMHNHLWLVERSSTPIGVRLFCYLHRRDLGYGVFIGVQTPYRSAGLGSWLVQQTKLQLALDAQAYDRPEPLGYFVEVDRAEDANSEMERLIRQRRLNFQLRNGAVLLPVDYLEPPLPPAADTTGRSPAPAPRPMHLVFHPTGGHRSLTRSQLLDLLNGIYSDVYQLPATAPLVRQVMNSASERGAS